MLAANTEIDSDDPVWLASSRMARADRSDLRIRQLRPRNFLTVRNPVLCGSVAHVLRLISKKKMSRIEARRIIASMQDKEMVRDRPDPAFVSQSVHKKVAIIYRRLPVSIGVLCSGPFPTSALDNFAITFQAYRNVIRFASDRYGYLASIAAALRVRIAKAVAALRTVAKCHGAFLVDHPISVSRIRQRTT